MGTANPYGNYLSGNDNFGLGFSTNLGLGNSYSKFDSGVSNAFKPQKQGGGMVIDPVTAVLGGLNTAAGFFSGMRQADVAEDMGRAQIETQLALGARKEGFERDKMMANMGLNLANTNAFYGWGADAQLAREKEAALFRTGPLAEREMNLRNREKIFNQDLANSMSAREFEQRQQKMKLEQSLAQRMGASAAIFGRTAPINVDLMFS